MYVFNLLVQNKLCRVCHSDSYVLAPNLFKARCYWSLLVAMANEPLTAAASAIQENYLLLARLGVLHDSAR